MLYETPLVVATTVMSTAIFIPQYSKLLENTSYRPGIAIVIGACLAGFSVFVGVSFALCCKKIVSCIGSLLFWGTFALATSWLAASCALVAVETGIKFFYLAAACLPLVVYLYNILTQWNGRYCKN